MIKTGSPRRGKRGRKAWILPGLLGVFLLHPFSADLSHFEHLEHRVDLQGPPSAPGLSADSSPEPLSVPVRHRSALQHREEKIFKILSRFVTGLTGEQELKLAAFINQESRRYGFDPELIIAVISTESSFYNWSVSSKGALGLMQLIPTTGKELAEMNNVAWHGDHGTLFDPFLNIQLGIHYLYTLYLKFGDVQLALTAYNHGPGSVARWLREGEKVPTRYAEKVLASYEELMSRHQNERKSPPAGKEEKPSSLPPSVQMVSRS